MMWHLNEIVAREHMNDWLREAQHDRDIRAARGARGRSSGLYRSAIIWLGRRLIAWGGGYGRGTARLSCGRMPGLRDGCAGNLYHV